MSGNHLHPYGGPEHLKLNMVGDEQANLSGTPSGIGEQKVVVASCPSHGPVVGQCCFTASMKGYFKRHPRCKEKKLKFKKSCYDGLSPYLHAFGSVLTFTLIAGLVTNALFPGVQDPLAIALALGGITTLLFFWPGHRGGIHFNPAATLLQYILQFFGLAAEIPWWAVLILWVVQLAGAVLGSLIVLAFVPSSSCLGATFPGPVVGGSDGLALFAEAIGSTLLFIAWFLYDAGKVGHPLLVGFVQAGLTLVFLFISGASFNPARSFGPWVVTWFSHSCGSHFQWVYWFGPFLGAGAALAIILVSRWLRGQVVMKTPEGYKTM